MRVICLLTTDRQTVNYYSTIHAQELIYFDSIVLVVYFDKNYIEHKAHIKCTNVKTYKTHVHKMRAKCHVIGIRDNTKSK